MIRVWLVLIFFLVCSEIKAQTLNETLILKVFEDNNSSQVIKAAEVESRYSKLDSAELLQEITKLERAAGHATNRVVARVKALKARLLFYKLGPGDSLYAESMYKSLEMAYDLDDPFLIAEFSRWYGEMLNTLGDPSRAAQYCLNSIKMQEELGKQYFPDIQTFYLSTGDILFNGCNSELSQVYYLKGLSIPQQASTPLRTYAGALNSAGFIYHLKGKQDSALYFLNRCLQLTRTQQLSDLNYLAYANSFKPHLALNHKDSCTTIAERIYRAGAASEDDDMKAESAKMYGLLEQSKGNYKQAIIWFLMFVRFGEKNRIPDYKFHFSNLADCYEKIGEPDKAYPFLKEFRRMKDSLSVVNMKAGEAFLLADASFKQEIRRISEAKKKQERTIIFLLVAATVFISGIAFATYRMFRKKQQAEHLKAEAENRNVMLQGQFHTAAEQIKSLHETIARNESEMEQLKTATAGKQVKPDWLKIEILRKQVILTENDWILFRENFEALHPGFFTRLKTRFPEITNAELRMAALVRLNFETRHVASMLGISPQSVYKTRYRLQKRFNGHGTEFSLEEIIASF